MVRNVLIAIVTFIIAAAFIFGVGVAASGAQAGLPQTISAATPCPVAGCTQADAGCHGAGSYPQPDGQIQMTCPKIKDCSSADCHNWERIESMHSKPSDASLNLWILAPVLVVVGLVALVIRMK